MWLFHPKDLKDAIFFFVHVKLKNAHLNDVVNILTDKYQALHFPLCVNRVQICVIFRPDLEV